MEYLAPATIDEAVSQLAGAADPVRILAGGTDLLVQLRAGMVTPGAIVDIKHIPQTRSISQDGDDWVVGAAVTGAEFNEHDALAAAWPGVAEAFDLIGSTQIQGRATLGGNLCNASPAADSVPALIAAGAIASVAGPKGERQIPVEDVNIGPGKTSLAKGEFVVSFRFPARPPRSGDAYLRLIPRTEMDIAVVGAGVNITLDDHGKCTHARISLGAVAPKVLLVQEAANALIGGTIDVAALDKLQAAASAACQPIDDKRGTIVYRTKVAGVLARRAALIALERAQQH